MMKLSKEARAAFVKVGAKGGKARAARRTKAELSAIGKLGAAKRWEKKKSAA